MLRQLRRIFKTNERRVVRTFSGMDPPKTNYHLYVPFHGGHQRRWTPVGKFAVCSYFGYVYVAVIEKPNL
jgi:hypothetical protein